MGVRRVIALGDTALLSSRAAHVAPAAAPAGILDVVPAFGAVAVHFDPTVTAGDAVTEWLNRHQANDGEASPSRLIELPVCYGDDLGPDLDAVAKHAGLSADEVVRRHAGAEYVVGAVGFQPGFGYLEGLPTELQTPRRATPRTALPAGAVGIGGPYTGVYPQASPGGWNLIGQTPLVMFDEGRDEPSLLRYGDRVRFVPIDRDEFYRLASEQRMTVTKPEPEIDRPLLRVVSPGVQTTVQGLGRFGQQHLGVSPGGAMDTASLRLANRLVGNAPETPVLEATLVGPVLEAIEPVTLGVAGAVSTAHQVQLQPGQKLDLRRLVGGARAYVAFPGGVSGAIGKPLEPDTLLGSLDANATCRSTDAVLVGVGWRRALGGGVATLGVLRGPQAEAFGVEAWRRLLNETYRVTPQSSRMGVRLEGPALQVEQADDLPSQPVCHGALQVPPGGQPIVLGADRQTLGGYPVMAVIASADWPALGQLAPGDPVRFVEITLDAAIHLRQQAERDLAIAAVGIQLQQLIL
ncbi:Kinase A inhibitor [Botrimarina colliarenosi]|uniref:Kinase A inhibitor n=1 Tax=Botrimarina colliarenosi TaxID=2528001 RepID=A0A5C6ALZ5_9BACT|nr:5-oxoprolinase subunit PxpB [Botrimarina colliarenosi]TWU00299.1 Kinase A inhibitor [Botrimarina colliarenosi]